MEKSHKSESVIEWLRFVDEKQWDDWNKSIAHLDWYGEKLNHIVITGESSVADNRQSSMMDSDFLYQPNVITNDNDAQMFLLGR